MTEAEPKKSDLKVRTLSAIVMMFVAGGTLWIGGMWWRTFIGVIGAGILWEWLRLSRKFTTSILIFAVWIIAGIVYIGLACFEVATLGSDTGTGNHWSRFFLIAIFAVVIGTDVGAYFVGRAIGGPKIAPKISPSKTWSGLVGGMVGGTAFLLLWSHVTASSALMSVEAFPIAGMFSNWREALVPCFVTGTMCAILAQAGDFFESWMKRKAGEKDSSHLIPGHGGLFDRADGMLAVAFVFYVSGFANICWFMCL